MNHSYNLDMHDQIMNVPGTIELSYYDDYDIEYFPNIARTAYQNKVSEIVLSRWSVKCRGRDLMDLAILALIEIWHTDDFALPKRMWGWKRFTAIDLLVATDSLALRELHLELIASDLEWDALETEPFAHANLLQALDLAYAA